jgi:hypothetical protein
MRRQTLTIVGTLRKANGGTVIVSADAVQLLGGAKRLSPGLRLTSAPEQQGGGCAKLSPRDELAAALLVQEGCVERARIFVRQFHTLGSTAVETSEVPAKLTLG